MPDQVALTVSQNEFKVEVGGTATATATVRNRGTVVDQFRLSLEGLDPSWWEIAPPAVSLFPDDEATATITIHPPAGALAGTSVFRMLAASVEDSARSAEVEARLEVAAVGGLTMTLDPAVASGRSGRYSAKLSNRANAEAQITLVGKDQEEALEYGFEPPTLVVLPYGENEASLVVRPRSSRAWGQPKSYGFTAQAVPSGQEEVAAEASGELQYRPLLVLPGLRGGRWRWLLVLIPLLALALLIRALLQPEPTPASTPTAVAAAKPTAAAAGKAPADAPAKVPPPVIASFDLVGGQPGFSLTWKVDNADAVELNGSKVDPSGKMAIAEPKDQGYELKATNKGGTVAKRINTLVFPPPVVKSLTATPAEVYQGQPSVLRWEVAGAERARIGDQEAGIPQGWLEVRPEATRDYVMSAENGVGWVVQRVTVKVINGPPPSIPLQTYKYDFKEGSRDWELGTGVWSRVPWEGGYALRGAGHGFVRLTAYSGEVTSLRFRFRLEDADSVLQANISETIGASHARNFISFSREGIRLQRQRGNDFRQLAFLPLAIAAKDHHEARITLGRGSIDVSLDGKPIVGVDDPEPLPSGYVSFESMDRSVVYVQEVEAQIGPQPSPPPRAPRPPR